MFKDRAEQFKARLDWDVTVDEYGWERDEYDALNPLYIIWEDADGRHGGSMRTLPTVGRTMINEHFRDLTDGVPIGSPLIWECTRFCLAPGASSRVAAGLLLARARARACGSASSRRSGVFDARMPRIYGRIGHTPDDHRYRPATGRDAISVGLWNDHRGGAGGNLAPVGHPARGESPRWFDASFPAHVAERCAEFDRRPPEAGPRRAACR